MRKSKSGEQERVNVVVEYDVEKSAAPRELITVEFEEVDAPIEPVSVVVEYVDTPPRAVTVIPVTETTVPSEPVIVHAYIPEAASRSRPAGAKRKPRTKALKK